MHLELDPSPNGWTNACSLIQHDTSETGNRHDNPWIHFFFSLSLHRWFSRVGTKCFFSLKKIQKNRTWNCDFAWHGNLTESQIEETAIHGILWHGKVTKHPTNPHLTTQKTHHQANRTKKLTISVWDGWPHHCVQSLAQPLLLSPSVGFARETWVSALKHDQFFLGKNKPLMVESLLFSTVCWW